MADIVTEYPELNRPEAFTQEGLGWVPWLAPVAEGELSAHQRDALIDGRRAAMPYFRLLARDPEALRARTLTDLDIFFNVDGGIGRAERELAAAATSRRNGCVFCASVHAAAATRESGRREDVQRLLDEGVQADLGDEQWNAVVAASVALADTPLDFGGDDIERLRAAGLEDAEIIDVIGGAAFFNWANRLMLSLGEPEIPRAPERVVSVPGLLDHVVIAGPDLAALVDWFAEKTGVVAAPGGAHPTGTANALVALSVDGERGPQYIELIGPDPERVDAAVPETFAVNTLDAPAVQAYAVHPPDIQATVAHARSAGYDPGDVSDLSRRTLKGTLLEWRLTRGNDRRLDVPFLIDWGSTPQPGLGDIPVLELVSFVREEPHPEPLRRTLDALGLGPGVAEVVAGGASRYRLELRRPDGVVVEL